MHDGTAAGSSAGLYSTLPERTCLSIWASPARTWLTAEALPSTWRVWRCTEIMAEKTIDMTIEKIAMVTRTSGNETPCVAREPPLTLHQLTQWVPPGRRSGR